jgi:hypothetical protein
MTSAGTVLAVGVNHAALAYSVRASKDAAFHSMIEEDMSMKRTIFLLWLACLLPAWTTGCAPLATAATATPSPTPSPVPLIQAGQVTFTRYDGQEFYGHVYGHGKTAILFSNMAYGGQEQWAPLVKVLDRDKFTVITFTYLMNAQGDYSSAENELQVVLDTLKGLGFKRFICVGASLGVSACGYIANDPGMVGMVAVAGQNFGGTYSMAYPKLFISGELDKNTPAVLSDYKRAADPKTLILYPEIAVHGADMFYSNVGDQFLKDILDFINKLPEPPA